MLLALWSPKGGSGTSVLAAACAVALTRAPIPGGCRLADLDGDQPAIFGLPKDPTTGLADWIALAPHVPSDALERLAVDVAPGISLLPRGGVDAARHAAADAGAALAVALRDGEVPTVADVGRPSTPSAHGLVEVADHSVVVVRGCYLALRRAVQSELLERASGVVLVEEPGRSLGAREVADVLGRPMLARIPVRAATARSVDAGVLAARPGDGLLGPVASMLRELGLIPRRSGRAA
ncbi:MAG: ATPase involved in chromosome partitioning [Actinomycetia bacterium]|nr:ATPase involved in chromosome partitioning [Actinomycetes bacterium]